MAYKDKIARALAIKGITDINIVKEDYEKFHIDITNPPLPFSPCLMDGTDETVKFNVLLAAFKSVYVPSGTLVANVLYEIIDTAIASVDIGISIKGSGCKSSIIKAPMDNTGVVTIKGKSEATLTLKDIQVGDTVTINGLVFTAQTTTTFANREFAITGDETIDANTLVSCISDLTYGVANIYARNTSTKLTLLNVQAGDTITINGIIFTAHATTTNKSLRQFAVNGTDASDAYSLAICINDATYGVPNVISSLVSNVMTLKSDTPETIRITNIPSSITTSAVINLVSTDESNLKIIITSSNSTRLSTNFYRYSLYNLQLENIHITGATNNSNNIGLRLDYIQNLTFADSRIDYCYGGGILLNDTMDCTFKTTDIVYCSKANSDTDYSYAIQLNEIFDCCNALKFDSMKLEHNPCIFYSNGRNRHNYFVNCKFEKSIENKTTLWNPLKFVNAREFGFANCMFINTHGTFGTTVYAADNGLFYIYSSDTSINTDHQRQRISFIKCDFTTNAYARVQWANIVNVQITDCDFFFTRGTNSANAPFMLRGYCEITKTIIAVTDNSRCFHIENKFNVVDVKLNIEAATPTLASIWLDETADENELTYSLIKNNMATNYILAPAFELTRLILSNVQAGDTITINGTTFTAHATTTTKANREFAISGDDSADAVTLVSCINDITYGVSGVTASNISNIIKLVSNLSVTVTNLASTITTDKYTYTERNSMHDKTLTYIATNEPIVVMRSCNIAKVGGNVSLLSNISNGQIYTLIATDSITITHSQYIILKSGANVNLTVGQTIRLQCVDGICYEI